MSSNKYVTLSLYFTLSPKKSPAEAIAAVNRFIKEKLCMEYKFSGLHGNLWVNQREIHQNPSSVKRQSGITAPVGRFYSVCRLTAART